MNKSFKDRALDSLAGLKRYGRTACVTLTTMSLLWSSCCLYQQPSPKADRDLPLDTFIASVRVARLEDYTGRPGARVESAAAFEVYLGAGFDHYSERNGGQWGFNLQVKRHTDGNWWLFYRGPGVYIPFGYYPGSLYGEGPIARNAERIGWGGEDTGRPSALQDGERCAAGRRLDSRRVSRLFPVEQPSGCYLTNISNSS